MSADPKTTPESPRRDADQGCQSASATGREAADPRQERLAQALRDNLKKRKAQQRERRGGA